MQTFIFYIYTQTHTHNKQIQWIFPTIKLYRVKILTVVTRSSTKNENKTKIMKVVDVFVTDGVARRLAGARVTQR